MEKRRHEQTADLSEVGSNSHQIMDALNRLISVSGDNSSPEIKTQFDSFCTIIHNIFIQEEHDLADLGFDLLKIQQGEHGALSRMLSNMQGLMETSDQLRWRTAVVDEAVDALVQHFAKEDADFTPLSGRCRRRISSQKI